MPVARTFRALAAAAIAAAVALAGPAFAQDVEAVPVALGLERQEEAVLDARQRQRSGHG